MDEKLKGKIQLLTLTINKTKGIVDKGIPEKIERHKDALSKVVASIEESKREVEQSKLEKGELLVDVEAWGREIEQKIDKGDIEITRLRKYLDEVASKAEQEKWRKQEEFAAKQYEDQLRYDKALFEQKIELEKAIKPVIATKATKPERVRLPKLEITKFDGALENWLPFWNKFEAEIDSSDMVAVTKFAYLKELLEPKVREGVDGLQFTTEGYKRAKNILKTEYGKVSEIVNTYIENIMALPVVVGSQPSKVHEFYHKLSYNVQSLESLGKLSECWGLVRSVLNKLKGIKADLVRGQTEWQTLGFPELVKALQTWKDIHPIPQNESPPPIKPPRKSFQIKQGASHQRGCVYCDDKSHKSSDCKECVSIEDRKRKLRDKGLCFNCTGNHHRAAQCRSQTTCFNCKQKHHTSICDKVVGEKKAMTASTEGENVCHPVVVVKANGVKCRALLDTGATGSYASAYLLDLMKLQPKTTLKRRIQTIMGTETKNIRVYYIQVSNLKGDCEIPVCVTRVERSELLSLDNPDYPEMIKKYDHLRGVRMDDIDKKSALPVHLILGTNEYTKIKTSEAQRTGAMGEPVAERTKFGWTIMSTGNEANMESMFLTQITTGDYENLCRMDVLGLEDSPCGDQSMVHSEFLEQLERSPEGWYQTRLPWKGNHPPLPSNKQGSLRRLKTLTQRLTKNGTLDEYDAIIQEQLRDGIVEEAEMTPTGREFYIPHKAVVRENAASTKTRIVYDASARANEASPSLNDCLEVGSPLQNQLWSVLVRGRFHTIALTADIQKAFLQLRIHPDDRDALRFHWLVNKDPLQVCTLRFTRALFGLGPSPFLLGGVIQHHLNTERSEQPKQVEEIERSLYVDDILSGGQTVEETKELKNSTTKIFETASLKLHKWNSNVRSLEEDIPDQEVSLSHAKEQLGVKGGETTLLGLKWNKERDTIGVTFPENESTPTKRGILSKVAKIYDPLGLVSPITLGGKLLYREACNEKCPWDSTLSKHLVKKWQKWESQLPCLVEIPRALPRSQEPIHEISLHSFGDASGKGVAAAVYAVVSQSTKTYQGLVASKARLAKEGLTIPRLELVAGHMALNLVINVESALQGFPITNVVCWLDSSVALYWILGGGEFKKFVGNRVRKIRERKHVKWRHVPTDQNPADVASRSGIVQEDNRLWWDGPEWLSNPRKWPKDIVTAPSVETEKEAKVIKQIMNVAVEPQTDDLDDLLAKYPLWKTLKVCAWLMRFVRNARNTKENRTLGPITAQEIEEQKQFWVRRVQSRNPERVDEDRLKLNLQPNKDGVLECRGRLQGHYPVYIPDTSVYAEKLIEHAHENTLHGGVGLTMTKIREEHWISRLRRLAKRIINRCPGCKRFQAVAMASPPPGLLPRSRTEGITPFEVIGVDYAGPLMYRAKNKKERKAYVLLYTCSLTRAVYLELLPTLEMDEFIRSFKRFVARRGRPTKVYSDNGSTFVGAANWLRKVMKDEKFCDFLAKNNIQWQFNLSRAPWWGGQFERLVGLVKRALYKSIGRGGLFWEELEEVLIDVEVALNGRPLCYVEEDIQQPILTPNSMLFSQTNQLPELKHHHLEDQILRKRAKYLAKCKEAMWLRWTKEYIRGLRERHCGNKTDGSKDCNLRVGEVVIIRGDEKNRNHWKLGIVQEFIKGKDGIIRGAKLRAGKSCLERPVQHLYPLELSCDKPTEFERGRSVLNPEASAWRPRRDAAVAAELRVKNIVEAEDD